MRLIGRAGDEYREGGLGHLLGFAARWAGWKLFPFLPPPRWAGFSPSSVPAATLPRTYCSTVLVLGFPRSGSTWLGEMLGSAANALYLKEPITQTWLRHLRQTGRPPQAVFEVDDLNAPPVYRQAAALAFAAIPAFTPDIVTLPQQWRLLSLRRRCLVIKEVNPMATAWLLRRRQARVVYLLRHPAAVVASMARLGWVERPINSGTGEWVTAAYQAAFQSLSGYPEHVIVRYEELCADPVSGFRALFAFAGLDWDPQMESRVREHSFAAGRGDLADPFGTTRDSGRMIRSWVGHLDEDEMANLKAAYLGAGLPWYASAEDWS